MEERWSSLGELRVSGSWGKRKSQQVVAGKNETMKRTTIEQRKEGRVVNVLIEIINK